jgi:hypothetical protein
MRRTSVAAAALILAGVTTAAAQQPAAPADSAVPPAAPSLVREVFAYEGAGRDPFMSLIRTGDVRPLISDVRLVAVYYDARYPARSVAVLRDITTSRIYRVKPGEIIGRLRTSQIRPREVVFTVQEFGYERQETLSLATQQEE